MRSVLIWSSPITSTQAIGYTIALGGLMRYKLGGRVIHAAFIKFTRDEKSNTLLYSHDSLRSNRRNASSKRLIAFKTFAVAGLCAAITLLLIPRSSISPSYLSYTELSRHPIEILVERSRQEFQQTLAKQSTTLAEAVREYERRNGIHPPPKFDIYTTRHVKGITLDFTA